MAVSQELREITGQRPLEGKLVRLRALEPEDEPLLHEWYNDPEVYGTLGGPGYPKSHALEKEWIEKNSKPSFEKTEFGIVALADGQLIGSISLRKTSPENRSADLGLAIGNTSRWGQGYATDALRVVCRFGLEYMNLHRIELGLYEGNAAALRVYEKVGFQLEGRKRETAFFAGSYRSELVMGLLRGELRWDSETEGPDGR